MDTTLISPRRMGKTGLIFRFFEFLSDKPVGKRFLRFISNIGTPANSVRISRSLIEKELLLATTTKKETRIEVYDVFFSRWLEMEYQ